MQEQATPAMNPTDMYEELFIPAIFGPLVGLALEHAKPRRGERALDLACGTGVVARNLAPRIGDKGEIVALDVEPEMLSKARSLPAPEGASIRWINGDAMTLDLPSQTFDLIMCQQGLQYFPDRAAGLKEMRRVLADGGRASISVWRTIDRHPLLHALSEAERPHLERLGLDPEEALAPFSLGDAEELRGLFEAAGFRDIRIEEASIDAVFPSFDTFVADLDFAYAAVVPELAEDQAAFNEFAAAVQREIEPEMEKYRHSAGISFPMHTHIATAW